MTPHTHFGWKAVGMNGWENLDRLLSIRYSLRWRWGFWQVIRSQGFLDDERVEKSYIKKSEAIAHLVRLKLEGKEVQL